MPSFGVGPWGNGGVGGATTAALTVFDYAAGTTQLAVPDPDGFVAPLNLRSIFSVGTAQFVLGSDLPGEMWRAAAGDYVEVAQLADWAANVLRVAVQVRPPVPLAPGVVWTVTFTVDGATWDSFTFAPGDPPRMRQSIAVRGASIGATPHNVAVRLTLTSSPTIAAAQPIPHPSVALPPMVVAAGSVGTDISTFTGSGVLHVAAVPGGYPTAGSMYLPRLDAVVSFTGASGATVTGCTTQGGASGALALADAALGLHGTQVTLSVSGATNPPSPAPIVLTTTTPHGLLSGDAVAITGVLGNTAANGLWQVTAIDAMHLALVGSVGTAVYTSGGTVTSPPSAPVLYSAGMRSLVELPGVYVVCFAQDNS